MGRLSDKGTLKAYHVQTYRQSRRSVKLLLRDTLLIDGITRGGKSLVGLLMRAFDNAEKVEICYPVEHVISGVYLNQVSKKFALEMINSILNERIYDLQISRNVNFREQETTSSVWPEFKAIYQERLRESDGDIAVNKILNTGKMSPFITHELFMELSFLLEIPQMHVLEIIRNPIEIFWSWNKKNWAQRFGQDPRSWRIMTNDDLKERVPWFMAEFPEYWYENNEYDRIALAIAYLTKEQLARTFSLVKKSDNLDVCFTNVLFSHPEIYLYKWSDDYSLRLRENWRDVFTTHKLPRKSLISDEANMDKLEGILSEHSFSAIESAYHEFRTKSITEQERLI